MLSLLVTKVGHNVISASHVSLLTSFSLFASSNFVIFLLRGFEADNFSHHFVHQQCRLLVTKDAHNPLFALQVFLLTSFSKCAFFHFRDSVLQSFEAYNASYQFIHPQCCLLVIKFGHNLIFCVAIFFCWQFSHSFLLAKSWFLINQFLERILILTTLFINSVVCWSPKMVTTLNSHRKFFCWHLSHSSFLASSWILFYKALRRIMLFASFFIKSVVCWSIKMATIL